VRCNCSGTAKSRASRACVLPYSHTHGQTAYFVLFFFPMALPAHSGPRPLIQFRNHFSQTVGLLGRVISPSQGRYLNAGKHKQNKRIHIPNIHALSGIRTHDPSVQASEDSSCLRPRGYTDRHVLFLPRHIYMKINIS
jgi:hypothetical protein